MSFSNNNSLKGTIQQLKEIVTNALKAAQDMRQVVSYQPLLEKEDYELGIVGRSEPMQQVFKLIGQLAGSDATAQFDTTEFVASGYNIFAAAVGQQVTMALVYFTAVTIAGYFFLKTREIAA